MDRTRLNRMIFGEPMPDKNDPKYKERYEREKELGARFAEKVGINYLAVKLHTWGNAHKKAFIAIFIGLPLLLLCCNLASLIYHYNAYQNEKRVTAVELVDKALKQEQLKNR